MTFRPSAPPLRVGNAAQLSTILRRRRSSKTVDPASLLSPRPCQAVRQFWRNPAGRPGLRVFARGHTCKRISFLSYRPSFTTCRNSWLVGHLTINVSPADRFRQRRAPPELFRLRTVSALPGRLGGDAAGSRLPRSDGAARAERFAAVLLGAKKGQLVKIPLLETPIASVLLRVWSARYLGNTGSSVPERRTAVKRRRYS